MISWLVGLAALTLLQPISLGDTDLWYHLTGGRYFFDHGELYNPYFVSFITPQAEFTNYFWGFQASVYAFWLLFGDIGPIVFRALLLVPCGYFLLRILFNDDFSRINIVQLGIGMLAFFLLSLRVELVRPHLATLLFVSLFLYVLLYRPKWFWALPLFAICWVNLHGVGWVIGAVICGAYVFDRLVAFKLNDEPLNRSIWWVLACAPAILLNPAGIYLLPTPFLTESSLSSVIVELFPFKFDLTWEVGEGLGFHPTIAMLMVAYGLALVSVARQWREHLFPLLISLVSFALFLRGQRFVWECLLLCAPLLGIYLQRFTHLGTLRSMSVPALLSIAALFYSWMHIYNYDSDYPLDDTFPVGTTKFLQNVNLSTEYALPPTLAGYAEWKLTPQYRIHSDMQYPPFKARLNFEIFSIQYSAASFSRFVEKYAPGFVAVYVESGSFLTIAAGAGYAPVFFDNRLVLFASRVKLPELVAEYEITSVNPFDPYEVAGARLDLVQDELVRMLKIDPDNHKLRSIATDIMIEEGSLEKADKLLLPEYVEQSPLVQFQKGRLMFAQEDYAAASRVLEAANDKLQDKEAGVLSAEAAFLAQEPARAFDLYQESINQYLDPEYDVRQLYQYAFAALVTGEVGHARDLHDQLLILDGHGGVAMTAKIEQLGLLISEVE